MALIFIGFLMIIASGSVTLFFVVHMRLRDSANQFHSRRPDADRYRPMLRLLSDADLDFAATNPLLRSKIRARRRELWRGYLRCLSGDYAWLLGAVRRIMVESGVDRPDLAKAIAKNRMLFAFALCRIEFHLHLHALGVGKVDMSGLVAALNALRDAINVMTPAIGAAY